MPVNFNPHWILPRLLGAEQFLDISSSGSVGETRKKSCIAQYIEVRIGLNDSTKSVESFCTVHIELMEASCLR